MSSKQINSKHLHTKNYQYAFHYSILTYSTTVKTKLSVRTHPTKERIFNSIPQDNLCAGNLNKDFFPPNRSCSSLRNAEKPAGLVVLPLWQLWQLARGAFHWSTSLLNGNYIDCRTNCLVDRYKEQTQKAWTLGQLPPSDHTVASHVNYWQLWQSDKYPRPFQLVTTTVAASGALVPL